MNPTPDWTLEQYARRYLAASESLESLSCFAALARETRALSRRIPVRVIPTLADPYQLPGGKGTDVRAMVAAIRKGSFFVFCGSGPDWETAEQTTKARASHDYFGHFLAGAGFDWEGERKACESESRFLSIGAGRALLTEVLGQASVFLLSGQFPVQKRVLLA